LVLPKYVAGDDASSFCLGNIRDAFWENSIAIVSAAISGEEANQTLFKAGERGRDGQH
jgi:hypothetical protein